MDQLDSHIDPAVTDTLLRAAGEGDRTAFAALFDRTAHVILGCLTRALTDRAEAHRAAVAVYVRLWRTAPQLAHGSAHTQLEILARGEVIRRRRLT